MKIKENNKKNYLNQQGITLIALVITIIVLLILAAVTISTVFGENGLLKSIEIAREKTEIAEYKEDLNQKLLEAKMNVLLDNSKVLEETRKIILRDKKYDGAVVSKVEDNKFTVITKEGYKFEVTPDGAEYLEKTSGTIEENKGSIVMTAAVEGEKANITFELKTEKTKEQWATEWIEKYTVDKSESDLEGEIVKAYNEKNSTTYEDFDKYLTAKNKTREDLKKEADEEGLSYKAYLFVQKIVCSEDMGSLMEMYFAYALDLSETETDYNKQLEIINDTDKLKASMLRILEYNSFEQLLEENEITEEEFEETMNKLKQQINLTDNQALCYITILLYEPITVNVSNGDSFKVKFMNIINSEPYEYTSSEVGTLTFTATGPQGMTGSIDIEFTAAKVKLTVKHINKSGTELKATTETEYDKDTAVTVKSETISGYKTYSAKITATEVNETLTEGAPVELSFGIYMDTEVVITYDVLQSGETEKEYEEKPTVSNSTEPVRVKPVAKDSSIKESLPTDIKNSDNSYMVDIEPVKSNSGPLTITLDVSDKAEDGDTANVRHYKNSVWDDLGDFIVAEGKITFTIDSFSPFCITIKKKGSSTGGEDPVTPSGNLPSTSYTTPYYPDNTFTKVEGTNLSNGLVIKDTSGNEYVWIEVPKTAEVYPTAGLEITNFTETEYTAIETDLHTYTDYYRRNKSGTLTSTKDEYPSDKVKEGTGLTSAQYTELKQKMLKSVYENGGFWIGRYEAGIEKNRTSKDEEITAAPLSKAGTVEKAVYPYTYVTCSQAQTIASKLTTGKNYTSSLMFGVQWDLVMRHIEVKEGTDATKLATIQSALRSDSKDWGNYYNASFEINRGKYAKDLIGEWNNYNTALENCVTYAKGTSTKVSASSILLTTGASDACKKMNIYDLAGNVYEWTLEYTTFTGYLCAIRGGYYGIYGSNNPASSRFGSDTTGSDDYIGFRTSLFK